MLENRWGASTVVTIGARRYSAWRSGGGDLLISFLDLDGNVMDVPEPWSLAANESEPKGYAVVRDNVIYPAVVS